MSNPNWGQPPQGPQGPHGPQWGQPQQPPYGQPPQYGQQPPNYGQPYGQAPQYGQGQWGGPPQGPPAGPPSRGGSKGPILAVLGVVVVAGIVVLTLFLTGVFGGDGDNGSPSAAVESLLSAAKDKDIDAVKANLCEKDRGQIDNSPEGRLYNTGIQSYSVGSTRQVDDSHALVEATVTVSGRTASQQVPVIKQDDDWKVCFSEATSSDESDSDTGGDSGSGGSGGGATTQQPTDSPSYGGPSSSLQIPRPGSTYTLPNGSSIVIPSLPPLPSYTP